MKFSIRLLYLYLFSAIGLIVSVIGTVQLVDLGIKVFVFQGADKYEYIRPKMVDEPQVTYDEELKIQARESVRNRQRQVSTAVAMILVGFPLYLYHWRKIKD